MDLAERPIAGFPGLKRQVGTAAAFEDLAQKAKRIVARSGRQVGLLEPSAQPRLASFELTLGNIRLYHGPQGIRLIGPGRQGALG